MTATEWADEHFYLSSESSHQAGKWKTLPYQRGILDAITDVTIEKISIQKSTRVGYTKMLNIVTGYHIDQDPCSILLVQPTVEDAEGYSKEELTPMLRDVVVLRGASSGKAKDGNNTILKKIFPGMVLHLVGANSPRGFRRITVRKVFFDEIDGYPHSAGEEGDQYKLGSRRTDYAWNRQIIAGSTPTFKGRSRIERLYAEGDQRRYYVPCPRCKEMQYLKWGQFDWTTKGTEDNPVYVCEHCGDGVDYSYHRWMMERGEWRAHAPFRGHASFHIWAAYSYAPNSTWRHLVAEYLEAKRELDDNRNPELMKTFTNTVLGETYEEEGKVVNINELFSRRENYPAVMPYDSAVLVGTVDTQDDRLELLVTAYGLQEECHILEHVILWGDPHYKEVWQKLDSYLSRRYEHEGGISMGFHAVGIDSGGHCTSEVYDFVRPRQGRGVYALKGSSLYGAPVISRPGTSKSNKGNVKLYHVGTITVKDAISARLQITDPGPRMIHFPDRLDYDFFEQMGNEHKMLRYRKGVPVYAWEPKKAGAKVEAWDLLVYSYAMMRLVCKSSEALDAMVRQLQQRCTDRKAGVAERPSVPGRRVISHGIE